MEFDHIGLPTDAKKDSESWVEKTKVWVTNPKEHPFGVEWLRFEPDSPAPASLKERPHVAFKVKSLEDASKGLKVLLEPFEVGGVLRVAFYEAADGSLVEFMEYLGDENQWF